MAEWKAEKYEMNEVVSKRPWETDCCVL